MMYFVKNLPKFDLCSMVKMFDLLLMYILAYALIYFMKSWLSTISGNHAKGELSSSSSVATGDGAYPRRLFKSASVNGAVTSSATTYAKRNPSLRSEVDMRRKEDCTHCHEKAAKPQKKSHSFGFELTKRFLKI